MTGNNAHDAKVRRFARSRPARDWHAWACAVVWLEPIAGSSYKNPLSEYLREAGVTRRPELAPDSGWRAYGFLVANMQLVSTALECLLQEARGRPHHEVRRKDKLWCRCITRVEAATRICCMRVLVACPTM